MDATVTVETQTLALIAAKDAPRIWWNGVLSFTPVQGSLLTTAREYPATGKPERIEGAFSASLAPTANAQAVRLDVAGELRASTIAPAPRPIPGPVGEAASAWPWILGAVVAAAGGGALLTLRKRKRPAPHVRAPKPALHIPPETREEALWEDALQQQARVMLEKGRKALGGAKDALYGRENLEAAEYHFRRAWQLAPCMGEAALGLGLVHHHRGEFAAAIPEFVRATFYLDTGEPDILAARSAIGMGSPEAAALFLRQALRRTGMTYADFLQLYDDPRLRALAENRPELQLLWLDAKERFVGDHDANVREWH